MASRIAQTPAKRGKRPLFLRGPLVALAMIVALAIIYCVLCGVAGMGDFFRSKISVNGTSLGGLTREEAVTTLHQALDGVTEVNGQDCARSSWIRRWRGGALYCGFERRPEL